MLKMLTGHSKAKTVGFIISMVAAVFCMALYMHGSTFLEGLEDKSLDLRFRLRGVKEPGNRVAIVEIDEGSIRDLGRWPWSRVREAELLDKLKEAGAKVVAFDIIFSEREDGLSAGQAMKLDEALGIKGQADPDSEALKKFVSGSVSGDYAFRDALARFGKSILPLVPKVPEGEIFSGTVKEAPAFLEKSAFVASRGDEGEFRYLTAEDLTPPFEELSTAASSSGHIYAFLDSDGVIRWEALACRYGDLYYPSLALDAAREYLNLPKEAMSLEIGEGVRLGDTFIPTDEYGRMLINYYGPGHTFDHYSFSAVLQGRTPTNAFKDKIVLVGATAMGIYDLRVTPFSGNMPGVEKHATVIENILTKDFLTRREESTRPLNLLVMLGLGIVLGLTITRFGPVQASVLSLCFLVSGWAACYIVMVRYGLWISMVYPTLTIVLIFFMVTTYRFLTEERKARSIKKIFASYVTPKMVDMLAKNPELAKLGGERKEITVMFSDVRGFTTFSESREPEEVVHRLNEYMGEMTSIIFEWDGTVDKFVGDEIMAFWGAPLPQEDQAERAVMCSVHMVRRLREMQAKWIAEGTAVLDMGIGLNTGDVVVGNMGAEGKKMDYTIIGDSVNLGARVETLTRNYDAHIIISEYTYAKLKGRMDAGLCTLDGVELTELDSVKVKGKERPVTIFRVDG